MTITLYHNPACGTSRNVLAFIRERAGEPEIIEYLKNPPAHAELAGLIRRMGMTPRELLRSKEKLYAELGLDDPKWTEADLIGFMAQHPVLMNRPIVATPESARLCRPAETVLDMLPRSGKSG